MFRKVSRDPKQELSKERAVEILEKATSGVLNVLGDDDYPYGVPMSYGYKDGKLYFHCMPKGHKIDAMRKHNKVSFTVIETDRIVPEEYTTYFRSAIAFGRARIVEDSNEKREALMILVEKYSPGFIEAGKKEIESQLKAVGIFVVEIDHISGKEASELVTG